MFFWYGWLGKSNYNFTMIGKIDKKEETYRENSLSKKKLFPFDYTRQI